MGNRTIGMIGVLSCLLGVNTVSYAGEAGNDVGKNHARWVVIQDDERVQNWMKQAGKHYDEENYGEAMKYYRLAADAGNTEAQNMVGLLYDLGLGVPENNAEAVKWYRKAALNGDFYAQNNLGLMYKDGEGITQNYAEAAKWFRKAADQNHDEAYCNLGLLYEEGKGVVKDVIEAVRCYRKSAELGSARGQCSLGYMYQCGLGVEENVVEAVKWYRKAVDQEYGRALFNLGVMYETGVGVGKDMAKVLYEKAVEQGFEQATKRLELLSGDNTTYLEFEELADDYYEKKNYSSYDGSSNVHVSCGMRRF